MTAVRSMSTCFLVGFHGYLAKFFRRKNIIASSYEAGTYHLGPSTVVFEVMRCDQKSSQPDMLR